MKCLTPGCDYFVNSRGLCRSCNNAARREIKKGMTTWEELEALGIAAPLQPEVIARGKFATGLEAARVANPNVVRGVSEKKVASDILRPAPQLPEARLSPRALQQKELSAARGERNSEEKKTEWLKPFDSPVQELDNHYGPEPVNLIDPATLLKEEEPAAPLSREQLRAERREIAFKAAAERSLREQEEVNEGPRTPEPIEVPGEIEEVPAPVLMPWESLDQDDPPIAPA